jgi:catechol 1,2-dioxygenase
MKSVSRRDFVKVGLATVGASGIVLATSALPTEASGDLGRYRAYLQQKPAGNAPAPRQGNWNLTEDNILGPFHRANAPFRAKVTPPLEPGTVVLIKGRVFGHDTRRPLANAVIDVWQANHQGRYDNDDPKHPPAADVFVNRARVITDENGAYEYESIKPGAYRIDRTTWRPSHIHYWIRATGYRELVTQLYFRGDEHQKTDAWIKESLIIDLREQKTAGGQTYRTGVFDIVLAPARRG